MNAEEREMMGIGRVSIWIAIVTLVIASGCRQHHYSDYSTPHPVQTLKDGEYRLEQTAQDIRIYRGVLLLGIAVVPRYRFRDCRLFRKRGPAWRETIYPRVSAFRRIEPSKRTKSGSERVDLLVELSYETPATATNVDLVDGTQGNYHDYASLAQLFMCREKTLELVDEVPIRVGAKRVHASDGSIRWSSGVVLPHRVVWEENHPHFQVEVEGRLGGLGSLTAYHHGLWVESKETGSRLLLKISDRRRTLRKFPQVQRGKLLRFIGRLEWHDRNILGGLKLSVLQVEKPRNAPGNAPEPESAPTPKTPAGPKPEGVEEPGQDAP